MKRILLLCLAVFGLAMCALAHPVNLETATTIASHFMGTHDLQLTATYRTDNGVAAFYVFNTSDGFVIVSANDCETPIIGYSHEGRFDPNDVPVQMEGYLQDFVARIQYGIENQVLADEATAKQWELVINTGQLNNQKVSKSVEPLLTEKWHQGCLYNTFCPTMSGPCGRAEAGCVAVAMGQIMHYWGYPATGWGSQSYSNAGTMLSADFGSTTYDWDHMPDSLTDASSEAEVESVATLLFHCGVSVKMSYTINGSGAESQDVPNALIRNFNYSRHLHREKKSNDNVQWLIMLKNNLDLQRPIYYSGNGDAGHAFVCDGYDNNDLLHFNWGWGGNADGYFSLGNLNPNGYDFSNNNYAIFDIFPQYEPCIVTATVYPPTSGSIEGAGEYHIGEQCTLTAVPAENSKFVCWKRDDEIVSYDMAYTFIVMDDVDNIEANFTYLFVNQITARYAPDENDASSPCVALSWDYQEPQWTLMKEFQIEKGKKVATDGESIYIFTSNTNEFAKYTMEGELVEQFTIDGVYPDDMAFDGTYFYYCSNKDFTSMFNLFCLDIEHKMVIDTIYPQLNHMQITNCAYDTESDGFWVFDCLKNHRFILVDRQGQRITSSPSLSSSLSSFIKGLGAVAAKDGNPHVVFLDIFGSAYYFDISNNSINDHPLFNSMENYSGAFVGKYNGKDAMFMVGDHQHKVSIYEIRSQLEQIIGYRIYRADSEGQNVNLAEEVDGSDYTDYTWDTIQNGMYRYGIGAVFSNGTTSEITWSDTIAKTNYYIDEHLDHKDRAVQKVFEKGHVVIIKDGKKYSILGQEIK